MRQPGTPDPATGRFIFCGLPEQWRSEIDPF